MTISEFKVIFILMNAVNELFTGSNVTLHHNEVYNKRLQVLFSKFFNKLVVNFCSRLIFTSA